MVNAGSMSNLSEDEGPELGGVEEHPWPSSLGGLQGVPGAAESQAEPASLTPGARPAPQPAS